LFQLLRKTLLDVSALRMGQEANLASTNDARSQLRIAFHRLNKRLFPNSGWTADHQ
jgi:hypothetical protein